MLSTIDLEREFFKAAKNLKTYNKARERFLARIKELAEDWIDNKFRFKILGLREKNRLVRKIS